MVNDTYLESFSKEDCQAFVESLEAKEAQAEAYNNGTSNTKVEISYNYYNDLSSGFYEVLDARSRLSVMTNKEKLVELEERVAAIEE